MPRFTATTSMGTFTVTDTANSNTVLSMAEADIHGDGSGATLTPAMSIVEIDREFGTPYGIEREMGFDLVFTFINTSGIAKQIGSFGLSGFNLATPVRLLDDFGTGFITIPNTGNGENYPGTLYTPTITIQDSHSTRPYNLTVALAYPVVEYDHAVNRMSPVFGGAGNVPSEIRFGAAFTNSLNPWFTIPDGESRRYTLMVRINDRTDTPIGPAADAPTEWLWTLRGYQRYFRRLYGKPDYRRMGGWDGRLIGTRNSSSNGTYDPMTNPRRFGTGALSNPSTNGSGGAPDGYFKFAQSSLAYRDLNVSRVLIWALSGFAVPGVDDYDPRFATGVLTLDTVGDGVGPTTVRAALRSIRDRMQVGLYWGRCTEVPESDTWSDGSRHDFDPTNAADVSRLRQETDLAINIWHAQAIGLDAYVLAIRNPGQGYRWLRDMQRRHPHVLFTTEEALPDFLHVIAPTFADESPVGSIDSAFWLVQYLNPGAEYCLQITGTPMGVGEATRAATLAGYGFTVVGAWTPSMPKGLRAVPRWSEVGESAIPQYRSPFHRPLTGSAPLG